MGQLDLRDYVALIRKWRRSSCAGVVSEDDERKFRQRQRSAFLAAGTVRHGIIPRHIAKRRKHLGNQGRQDKRLWRISAAKVRLSCGTPQLHQHTPYKNQHGFGSLEGSEYFRSAEI